MHFGLAWLGTSTQPLSKLRAEIPNTCGNHAHCCNVLECSRPGIAMAWHGIARPSPFSWQAIQCSKSTASYADAIRVAHSYPHCHPTKHTHTPTHTLKLSHTHTHTHIHLKSTHRSRIQNDFQLERIKRGKLQKDLKRCINSEVIEMNLYACECLTDSPTNCLS